jgi:hypothetical protein
MHSGRKEEGTAIAVTQINIKMAMPDRIAPGFVGNGLGSMTRMTIIRGRSEYQDRRRLGYPDSLLLSDRQ